MVHMAVPKRPDHSAEQGLKVPLLEYKTMARDPPVRPDTPDRASRSSFSSIRENDSDLAQTFTSSKVSSLTGGEEVVEDLPSQDHPSQKKVNMVETQFCRPVTRPDSKLLGYIAPADSFTGWKQINVRGKLASKSFGDLQALNFSWTPMPKMPRKKGTFPPGEAPFEKLPIELLISIINLLVIDVPPNGISRRNVDLMSLLLTSKTLHMATLNTLYSRITIPHSRIFHKFLSHISHHESLGTIVRRLDFSHLNPHQLFSTAAERSQARNLTSETLLQCLELTPYLQEFLAQEYVDEDIDVHILRKLFFGLPRLRALDFCGCSSTDFKNAFTTLMTDEWPAELSITRLSLHKCLTLPYQVLEMILPRLKHLTHLDVAGTRITDKALASIPLTARITHLNLAKCTLLSARMVIDFLAQHPAVKELVYLSIATDARSHQLLDAENVTEVISVLPKTLKSLSLKGSKMNKSHILQLLPLTKHLEELALGRGVDLKDINGLFVPEDEEEQMTWVPHSLKYLDLSDMWGGELDLPFLFSSSCALLKPFSEPLEVIEVADDVSKRLLKSATTVQRAGWRTSECGSRTWLVRKPPPDAKVRDEGRRGWKMGAEAWGMRKIPVARAEVGGMYGSFMFGRKL
ncbi:hypothetical protein BR93DRAFT_615720 [Coniochaeta sp. PMI_546]|nr:hypothetical protein BR93DRAFT_615720 [Coniochaeta sp. PMI_546]